MARTERYTVLSYIIGKYEFVHPVKEKSDRATYIMVTDDPELKDESSTWQIIVDDTLSGTTFDKCYQIRFNPFKYTNDDIIVRLDGSMGIESSLDPIVDKYLDGGYDLGLMIHPTRQTQLEEYLAWYQFRNYPKEQCLKVLRFMQYGADYDVKSNRGLAQMCLQIQKKNKLNTDLNLLTYAYLKYLGDSESGIERVDQTVYSFVLQKYFQEANIMWFNQRMTEGKFLSWYGHNSNKKYARIEDKDMSEPYFFNKKIEKIFVPEDF